MISGEQGERIDPKQVTEIRLFESGGYRRHFTSMPEWVSAKTNKKQNRYREILFKIHA